MTGRIIEINEEKVKDHLGNGEIYLQQSTTLMSNLMESG